MTDSDTTIPGDAPQGPGWLGVPLGEPSVPDRTFLASARVAAVGFIVVDGAWLVLWTLHAYSAAPSAVIVLAIVVGAIGAAVAPTPLGWFGLFIGAAGAAAVVSVVALPFVGFDGWAILGVWAVVAWNLILTGIFGSVGFGYWMVTRRLLRPRMAAPARLQGVLLAVIAPVLFVGMTIRNTPPPAPIVAANYGSIDLQVGERVGGTWQPVPGVAVGWPAHQLSRELIDPLDAVASGPGGILGPDHCTTRELVARRPDGTDFARHAPGLCAGGYWVISAAN